MIFFASFGGSNVNAASSKDGARFHVITDVNLANGSGTAAIAAICLARPTPHIFISADPSAVRGLQPAAIILEKPFHYADLERAIGRATQAPPGSGLAATAG